MFIKKYKKTYLNLKEICSCFEVSLSGYYNFLNKEPSNFNSDKEEDLTFKIVQAYYTNKGIYGYRKITAYLLSKGVFTAEHKVRLTLREKGLRSIVKRKYKAPKTTNSSHKNSPSKRIFKIEESKITKLNQVWVSDITYLKTKLGFCYLVIFLDLYSRKVISWKLSPNLETNFVNEAFFEAVKSRNPGKQLIVHSDRGVQYTSKEFRKKN